MFIDEIKDDQQKNEFYTNNPDDNFYTNNPDDVVYTNNPDDEENMNKNKNKLFFNDDNDNNDNDNLGQKLIEDDDNPFIEKKDKFNKKEKNENIININNKK